MASGFLDELLSGIFGDSKRPDTQRPDLVVPMLAHWLPYRSFDPKTGIFYNSASRGFVIEAAPLVGADERTLAESLRAAPLFDGVGHRFRFEGGQVNEALYVLGFRDGQAVLLE